MAYIFSLALATLVLQKVSCGYPAQYAVPYFHHHIEIHGTPYNGTEQNVTTGPHWGSGHSSYNYHLLGPSFLYGPPHQGYPDHLSPLPQQNYSKNEQKEMNPPNQREHNIPTKEANPNNSSSNYTFEPFYREFIPNFHGDLLRTYEEIRSQHPVTYDIPPPLPKSVFHEGYFGWSPPPFLLNSTTYQPSIPNMDSMSLNGSEREISQENNGSKEEKSSVLKSLMEINSIRNSSENSDPQLDSKSNENNDFVDLLRNQVDKLLEVFARPANVREGNLTSDHKEFMRLLRQRYQLRNPLFIEKSESTQSNNI